jgi:CrcB protein
MLIAVLGAAGALSRYGVGQAVGARSFPWSTLGINVVGALLLGLLLGAAPDRPPSDLLVGATVGFLGAFTTFSTFGYETQTLVRTDRVGAAAAYVLLSVVVGVGAAAVGHSAGRALT